MARKITVAGCAEGEGIFPGAMTAARGSGAARGGRYRDEFPIFRHAGLPQQLLARCALAPVARAGERVPRPLGAPRGSPRGTTSGGRRSTSCATGYGAADRRRGPRRSRSTPTSPPRLAVVGRVARLPPAPQGRRHQPRLPDDRLSVAGEGGARASRSCAWRARMASSVPLERVRAGAWTTRTALVATSHVFFTSGAIQDVRGDRRHRPPGGGAAPGRRLPGGRTAAGGRPGARRRLLSAPAGSSGCWAARASPSCHVRAGADPRLSARRSPAGSRIGISSASIPARWRSTTTRADFEAGTPPLMPGVRPARRARCRSRRSGCRRSGADHGA